MISFWKQTRLTVAGVALLAVAAPASALVIDFESITASSCNSFPSITTQGFDFTTVAPILFACDGTRVDLASNGTNTVGSQTPTITTMAQTGGGLFSLIAIDLAELFIGNSPKNLRVQVKGRVQGGGIVRVVFLLDGINDGAGGAADFETFILPGNFVNLTSLNITGVPTDRIFRRFMFDNIVVTTQVVPEPTSLLLLGVGLAALARRCGSVARAVE